MDLSKYKEYLQTGYKYVEKVNIFAMDVELFRSQEMQLVQLIIPTEVAHNTLSFLGELGFLQFKDMNENKISFQKTFVNQVRRCEEQCRKLRLFQEQIQSTEGEIVIAGETTEGAQLSFDELEIQLDDYERELLQVNSNNNTLDRKFAELQEYQIVLEKANLFFDQASSNLHPNSSIKRDSASINRINSGSEPHPSMGGVGSPLLESNIQQADPYSVRWQNIAGLVEKGQAFAFESMLWKATRGNMFLRQENIGKIRDPSSGELQEKNVFVIFFTGERARQKINKICESFKCTRYFLPEDSVRREQVYRDMSQQISEMQNTIDAGYKLRNNLLTQISSNWTDWSLYCKREKGIYHTLNQFSVDVSQQCLIGEAWCPISAMDKVRDAVQRGSNSLSGVETILTNISAKESPPTYFNTNKYTESFQALVESYGIANYREVNPAVYAIITFPFLFAVMFGDFGHGLMLLLYAGVLIYFEKKFLKMKLNEMIDMTFGGRYLILAMAVFAMYIGLLYNEMFSIPLAIFGDTKYQCPDKPHVDYRNLTACPEAADFQHGGLQFKSPGSPYSFGFDPVWHGTTSELPYFNGIKMKISVILGVAQMDLGIMLSLYNHLYFKDYLSIVCEFIPEVILLNGLFGYLCMLIIYKWTGWPILEKRSMRNSRNVPKIGRPPDLYGVLINMFLKPGSITCGGLCTENDMYDGQRTIQVILILLWVLCIPWMLIPKPLIIKWRHEASKKAGEEGYGLLRHQSYNNEDGMEHGNSNGHKSDQDTTNGVGHQVDKAEHHGESGHHGEFDFGEVLVHQLIHTIEFVLGTISNTASYLRLWALSLAHSQLSAVFFDKVVLLGLGPGMPPAVLFICVFIWFFSTMMVLMVMESLSAFLHALRLHWVEFQNKFYIGDGYKFAPFNFKDIDLSEI